MFDSNQFKSHVKDWIRNHPEGSAADLQDYCEELIPPAEFAVHHWMVDHTLSWYSHIIAQREMAKNVGEMDENVF